MNVNRIRLSLACLLTGLTGQEPFMYRVRRRAISAGENAYIDIILCSLVIDYSSSTERGC